MKDYEMYFERIIDKLAEGKLGRKLETFELMDMEDDMEESGHSFDYSL